jgi:hypothetical protein
VVAVVEHITVLVVVLVDIELPRQQFLQLVLTP